MHIPQTLSTLDIIRTIQDHPEEWPETMDMTEFELHKWVMEDTGRRFRAPKTFRLPRIDWTWLVFVAIAILGVISLYTPTAQNMAACAGCH